jgi:hypothetical protein
MEIMTDEVSIHKSCQMSGCRVPFYLPREGRAFSFFAVAAAILLLGSPQLWGQGTLRYTATDLTDVTPGEDLWEYSYVLSGFNLQTNQGFSIYFDATLFKDLQNPRPTANPQWSVITVQRDVLLQAPGYLDGLALVNSPSFQGPFQVAFVWLGVGVPGAQPFDVYDSNFQTLFSGSSVVPEPQSGLLALVGGLMLLGYRASRLRQRS